jgi:subtilisin-like proprotein convertase family protein
MNISSIRASRRLMRSFSAIALATATALASVAGLIFLFNRPPVARATGNTFYVAPGGDDGSACDAVLTPCATIQAAIGKASSDDTIRVATGTYTATGAVSEVVHITQSLTLSGGWDAGFTAQSGTSTIDAEDTPGRRGVTVLTGVAASLDSFTIQRGNVPGDSGGGVAVSGTLSISNIVVLSNTADLAGGGIVNDGVLTVTNSTIMSNSVTAPLISGGGGIANNGQLTLADSTVMSNTASVDGGGLINSGAATVTGSDFIGNTAGDDGGGLRNFGTLTVTLSTVSGNSATVYGGGVDNGSSAGPSGTLTVTRSLFTGNASTADGGGLYNENGTLAITNTTVSTNTASGNGGGVYNLSTLIVENATITDNTADNDANGSGDGGGLYISGAANVRNTIIAGNTDTGAEAPDCSGAASSQGYNIVGSGTGCSGFTGSGDQVGVDPLLGPLADNGGPTLSHTLLAGSPAINAADPVSCPATDQPGTTRPQGTQCDIGAVEKPVVQFSAASYSVNENGGTATITATLTSPAAITVTVNFATSDNTATAGSDYTTTVGALTFIPGDTQQSFDVPIISDTVYEASEMVTLTLSSPGNAVLGAQSAASLTISDDDSAPTLSIGNVAVAEGNSGTTDAIFTVTLTGDTELTATVAYTTADGTATAGSDFVSATGTLTFTPGTLTRPVTITVNGDGNYEHNEAFTVSLGGATNATITTAAGTGTINNDDSAPTLSIDDVAVTEGNSGATDAVFTVTLSGATDVDATVVYTTTSGTATAGSDFVFATGTLTFTPGTLTQPITVAVNGDTIYEYNENFTVSLGEAVDAAIVGGAGAGTINDDDTAPVIELIAGTFSVNEDAGSAVITATLTGQTEITATVLYTTTDGTAIAGSDYFTTTNTVTFAPGAAVMTFTVPITNDTTYETDETFSVTIGAPVSATLGAATSAAVTIVSEDPLPTVRYYPDPQTEFIALEGNNPPGSATVPITVTLDRKSVLTVTVAYSTTNDTATAPGDYLSASGALTFTPGTTTQSFDVTIIGNNLDGSDKTVNLHLGEVTGGFIGGDNPETLRIVDDDGPPQVWFSSPTYERAENQSPATIQVNLSNISNLTVTAVITVSDGTASRLTDYTSLVTRTVTIPGGQSQTTGSFTIPITNDVLYEGDETINLALGDLTNGVPGGFNQTAVLTILDNESEPTVRFSAGSYTVNETAPSALITATLSGQSAFTATVNVASSNGAGVGKATAGNDYTAVNQTLTFTPTVTTTTFIVPITNDTFYEGNEALTLTLGSPISNTTLGSPNPATLTIVDNESPPTVQLSASAYGVEEYGGAVTITSTLALAGGATYVEVPVTVTVATSNGTATGGSDYSATSSLLTFAPGVTSRTLGISIVNDTTYEGHSEAFNVSLSAPVSATLGSPGAATVTIFDDDPRPGCTIYNSTDVPKAIPDDKPAGVESIIALPSPGVVITDVGVRIDRITHTYDSDLRITLIPPTGPSVALVADPGVGADQDNFIHTILMGSATSPIGSGAAPFTGSFRPDNPLSSLNGLAAGGAWRLQVVDNYSGDVGTLEAWGLEICGSGTPPTSFLYLPLITR